MKKYEELENKINIGDYIRMEEGIAKIVEIEHFKDRGFVSIKSESKGWKYTRIYSLEQIKASPNIIDLIEQNDYVNGVLVKKHPDYGLCIHGGCVMLYDVEIHSIVTKEQFERMEYKV